MAWASKNIVAPGRGLRDVRTADAFKSFCRKCNCHHPLDSKIRSMTKGCICNPAGRRGECGRYVPTDNLEYLEYMSMVNNGEI